jgi:hypothetical protein
MFQTDRNSRIGNMIDREIIGSDSWRRIGIDFPDSVFSHGIKTFCNCSGL